MKTFLVRMKFSNGNIVTRFFPANSKEGAKKEAESQFPSAIEIKVLEDERND